jgi:uncharacterized membrane protein YbhN (UPF0104 family)
MKKRLSNLLSGRAGFLLRLFGTVLALVLLIYLLREQGWQEIGQAIQQIPWWQLLLALVMMLLSRLAVCGRWYILLRSSGVKMTLAQSTRITFAGLFGNNFLPTTIGGDVIRLAGTLQLGLDAAICTASLIVDRLVGMAGMAMAVPFGLPRFLEVTSLQNYLPGEAPQLSFGIASLPLGKYWQKVIDLGMMLTRRVLQALTLWIKQPRSLLTALVFTWLNMLGLFGVIWLLFVSMGQHVSFWQTGGLYSIVYFITLLPLSINGYGIQEVSMTFIFSSIGGATVQSGLTTAILFRTLMMITSLPGAVFVPGLLAQIKKQAAEREGEQAPAD